MNSLYDIIFGILFPKSEEQILVDALSSAKVLALSTPTPVGAATALLPFRNPGVRALIHEAKFHHNKKAIEYLGAALAAFAQLHGYAATHVFVPMPLSAARLRERGFNQAEEIVRAAKLPINTSLLTRIRNTRPQTELPRNRRISNTAGAFRVPNGAGITGTKIVLVDDVVTTGATFDAARAELARHHPASITCIALAH